MNNLGAIFSFFNVQTAQFNLQTWQIEILINSYLYVAFWSNQFVNFFLPFLASWDAIEPTWVSQSVSELLTLRTELTDVTLVSEDTYTNETDVILAIGDTYRYDVRSGWQVGRHVELIEVMPPVSQVFF